MSIDILKILHEQKKKRAKQDIENDPILSKISQIMASMFVEHMDMMKEEMLAYVQEEVRLMSRSIKNGRDGADGLDGKSIVGPIGPQGPKGDKPIAGIDYPIPRDGKDGLSVDESSVITKVLSKIPKSKDGYTPVKGVDYFDGVNGQDGKDGSPDTALQIADKLNTLDEAIDAKVIKGLSAFMKNIQRTIREAKGSSGGGMGMPVHETFSCNGSTNSFTLSSRVAANGNAAWIYYQGQFLVKTTHWTIADRTITLTLMPANGTKIDVTYIRS